MGSRNTKSKAVSASHTAIIVPDVDETTPLLTEAIPREEEECDGCNGHNGDIENGTAIKPKPDTPNIMGMIAVLLIGVFVSQADATLVLATYARVSSEFHNLEDGSWLFTGYILAQCVAQPLYGKLSDIFGRKRCLQVSYALFTVGTLGAGLSRTFWQLVAMRMVQGAGGAGMVCVVSILLTDLVPLHEVAVYRSYVNVVQTVGRSCGGVVGGLLTETVGWRWAFLVQCPPTLLAIALVEWKLNVPGDSRALTEPVRAKLKRVDWIGALAMSVAILTTLLVVDMAGQKYAITHPIIIGNAVGAVVAAALFVIWEGWYAKEPIFPLRLLANGAVVASYLILFLQNFAQMGLMLIVPIYFQVTANANTAAAGAYLIPAVFGNTFGGLGSGWFIKKTGRYKLPTILAALSSMACFTLILLVWRGNTSLLGSLLILPAGAATGAAHSSVFIGLTSGVDESEIAIAGSGLYLAGNVGAVVGGAGSSAAYQIALRLGLEETFRGWGDKGIEIIRRAMGDIEYVQGTTGKVRELLVGTYVNAVHWVFGVSLVCAVLSLMIGVFSPEKRLCKR